MFPFKKHNDGNILEIGKSEQYHTVDEIIKRSQPNSIYYTFLVLSAVIISAGILIDNTAILIGGMLVTPVLTPILLFSLGVSILEFSAVKKAGFLMLVSFLIIGLVAGALARIFGTNELSLFLTAPPSQILYVYFLVAFTSGIAATLAWTRKETTDVMPGVAMAVTLVPPVSLIGISFSTSTSYLMEFYLYVFVSNLIGLLIGGFLVYTLLKFYKTKKEVEKEIESQ